MSESELCRGREQREAVQAVQKAMQSYGEARDAIGRGEAFDGVRKLRSIAQWVAIAAAKAARACAAGQTSLPTSAPAKADDGLAWRPGVARDRPAPGRHCGRVA